jgi:hypothetical protein
MEKAIIVYFSLVDAYREKKRPDAVADALKELNDHLADGWSVRQSYPMGTGSEASACNLVILEKGGETAKEKCPNKSVQAVSL